MIVPGISSLIFWITLSDVVYKKMLPSYIASSINDIHEFGIEDWIIPLIIMGMNAITLIVSSLLIFRDRRNSWMYNIFCVIPGVFLIGPFLLFLCPWWPRWLLNITWYLWDLVYFNYLRFFNKFAVVAENGNNGNNANINNANNANNNGLGRGLLDGDEQKYDDEEVAIPNNDNNVAAGPGANVQVPFFQSNTWYVAHLGLLYL